MEIKGFILNSAKSMGSKCRMEEKKKHTLEHFQYSTAI